MKRYLLFTNEKYEASGGFNDFKKSFDSIDNAQVWINEMKDYEDYANDCCCEDSENCDIDWDRVINIDHWHIFDYDKRQVVLDDTCEKCYEDELSYYTEEL